MAIENIDSAIEELLRKSPIDFHEIKTFISDNEDGYDGDLAEHVFRLAVRLGCEDYVREYADDIDLNDEGDCSSYLHENESEDMQELLFDHGAFRSWDEYDECNFALETMNWTVLVYSDELQEEAMEKCLDEYDLSVGELEDFLEDDSISKRKKDRLIGSLEMLGITVDEDGDIGYAGEIAPRDLLDELVNLGYEVDFEGQSNRFESNGVYFIK